MEDQKLGLTVGVREKQNIRKTRHMESAKQGSCGLTETKAASTGFTWVCIGFSAYMVWLLAWCFVAHLTVEASESLTILPALYTHFLLLGCHVQPQYEGFCLILLHHVLSCLTIGSWRPFLFWR